MLFIFYFFVRNRFIYRSFNRIRRITFNGGFALGDFTRLSDCFVGFLLRFTVIMGEVLISILS
jgi:hypothetical protein